MELYPQHYTWRSKADEGVVDASLCLVLERLDELQKMEARLGDRIEDAAVAWSDGWLRRSTRRGALSLVGDGAHGGGDVWSWRSDLAGSSLKSTA
jgi:hypothetical protein